MAENGRIVTPERWDEISRLFHAALELEPAARAAFLAQSCGDDGELRAEVESLISSHTDEDDFLEIPPADVAAHLLGLYEPGFKPGQAVGTYRIVRQLGSGGMGEVYLADDLRLGRKIALKVLPPHATVHPDRVRRFEREARAASALNHPNIVTIYEIGQSDKAHFIATEFIDGKTLRELVNERPFTLSEALNVAIQVASALSSAHAAGIVHRDIKPENIMIRSDGYVKILDFGLAKLTEQQAAESDLETPTLLQSNPGLIMGTVQYMSPEQARGRNVGVRTDVWSLGIVLYELLSGRVPFSGETPSHVMVSLMEDELPVLAGYVSVPPRLERIVKKALQKNQRERYQTAGLLTSDLKNLKRELQLGAASADVLDSIPQRSTAPPPAAGSVTTRQTIALDRRTRNSGYLRRLGKSRKTWALVLIVLLITAGLGLGGFWFLRRYRSVTASPPPFRNREVTRLTNTGRVKDAAISPDGKYLGYISEGGGQESVWLKEVASPSTWKIVEPAERQYYGGTFSIDGEYFYFIAKERNNTIGALHRVPVKGGEPVKLLVDVDGPISFSPDGKQFAFVRGSSTGERALMIANADGGAERKLATRTGYDAFAFGGPAWSPDGQTIASGASYADAAGNYLSLVTVRVDDGSVNQITKQRWKRIGRVVWRKDGQGLIFNAFDLGRGSTSQLWHVSYPGGEAQRITSDVHSYDQVTLTLDDTTMVARQTQIITSLWVAPNNEADRAKEILSHNEDDASYYYFRTRFSYLPDGNLIYTSMVDGIPNLWTTSPDRTLNKQLTYDRDGNSSPSMTRDGRYIVFVSERAGFPQVWRMDRDGTNQVQLTDGEDDSWAWCSPDSRWVVFHRGTQGRRSLWRVPVAGGPAEQLTDFPSSCPVVSPDGKWIVFYFRSLTKAPWKLGIIPFSGGPLVKSFEIPANVLFQTLVRWTPDGNSLAYIANHDGVSNIWTLPGDGVPARQLTDFKSEQIFWFDWSPDGSQLGVTRGTVTSDAVLIKDLSAIVR